MGIVFAKVKDKDEPIRKLLDCDDLYRADLIKNAVQYSADTLLDEEQWFKISEFRINGFTNLFIEVPVDTTYPIMNVNTSKIDYLCTYQNKGFFFFQRVTKSRMVTNARLISFSGDAVIREKQNYIVIADTPDAVYNEMEDTLFFKDLTRISPMFSGVDKLFRIATEDEVVGFINMSPIMLSGGYAVNGIGKRNRQRITKAISIYGKMNEYERHQIMDYTYEYSGLRIDNGRYVISNEEEMKAFLYGIDQRYYTTPIGNERRVANSILVLPR